MKKTFTTLMIAFVVLIGLNKAAAQPEVSSGAQIEFAKDVHDYGTVEYGGNGECTFEFTNTGTAPLRLTDVKGSCSCTVPEWPKEEIAPGAKGKITVKYNTKNAGPINKSVTITSNATNDPVKVIRIRGTVSPQPDAAPATNTGAPATN